jgi:hypothetical protein
VKAIKTRSAAECQDGNYSVKGLVNYFAGWCQLTRWHRAIAETRERRTALKMVLLRRLKSRADHAKAQRGYPDALTYPDAVTALGS